MNSSKTKIKKQVKKHIPKDWLCELRILYRLTKQTIHDVHRTGINNYNNGSHFNDIWCIF